MTRQTVLKLSTACPSGPSASGQHGAIDGGAQHKAFDACTRKFVRLIPRPPITRCLAAQLPSTAPGPRPRGLSQISQQLGALHSNNSGSQVYTRRVHTKGIPHKKTSAGCFHFGLRLGQGIGRGPAHWQEPQLQLSSQLLSSVACFFLLQLSGCS